MPFCPAKHVSECSKFLLNKVFLKLCYGLLKLSETIRPLLYTKATVLWHLHFFSSVKIKKKFLKKHALQCFLYNVIYLILSLLTACNASRAYISKNFSAVQSPFGCHRLASIHPAESRPSILRSSRDWCQRS